MSQNTEDTAPIITRRVCHGTAPISAANQNPLLYCEEWRDPSKGEYTWKVKVFGAYTADTPDDFTVEPVILLGTPDDTRIFEINTSLQESQLYFWTIEFEQTINDDRVTTIEVFLPEAVERANVESRRGAKSIATKSQSIDVEVK
ncbi:MAG: hypothetical protein QNK23_16780 [Crocinitomicaceae bacterium]|nr:hypothetical protein [Crocinitomicaceae bacterium]